VGHCRQREEFAACVEVQKEVWGKADLEVVPLPIFVVAGRAGGQVLGAFDGKRMIGFTLALAGLRHGRAMLHSHMTAVLEPYRDRGVGRQLKLFQRQDALERGIDLVEWTFDPLEIKNAHFNLERLGAIARELLPNAYGITSSPLHGGLPTDRLVAEWWLRSPRVEAIVAGQRRARPEKREAARIHVPGNIAELKKQFPEEAARVQARLGEQFQQWFGRGYAVTGLEKTAEGADYLLEPFHQIQGQVLCG
jgi:predicted GNAT superfamily acetyltransferase